MSLTNLRVYTQIVNAPTLLLDDPGMIQRDKLQITKITGLNPVKSTINTSPFATIDGAAFTGSDMPARNIVITVKPNPDYADWTMDTIRDIVYLYFLPKSLVQLVFEDDVKNPRTIFGYVESCEDDKFSNDVQFAVSIICPDPYFLSLNPLVINGLTNDPTIHITYNGDAPNGFKLEVDGVDGQPQTSYVQTILTKETASTITQQQLKALAHVNNNQHFLMSSVPGEKYVNMIRNNGGYVISLLSKLDDTSVWPLLVQGDNEFVVLTDTGQHNWTLTYFEKFGGL